MKGSVLVTGATGFLGRHVVKELLARSIPVRSVVRSSSVGTELEKIGTEVVKTSDVFGEQDQWWEQTLDGIDTVIHLAWYVGDDYLTSQENLTCCGGTIHMGNAIAKSGVRRFISMGTCAEYAPSTRQLNVWDPIAPTTLYGLAKAITHESLRQQFAGSDARLIWCRIFYIKGVGGRHLSLIEQVKRAVDGGESFIVKSPGSILDYIDVEEAAGQIVGAAMGKSENIVNICSGVGTKIRDMVEQIKQGSKYPDNITYATNDEAIAPIMCIGTPSFRSQRTCD